MPDLIYVTAGNTFEVLKYMRDQGIDRYIREVMDRKPDAVYIGSSAGAVIAGKDIELAADFDANFLGMTDFTALGLFDGTIIPHYTREELRQYLSHTEKTITSRYRKIYSVSNEEIIGMKWKRGET